ncbi:MAG: glycine cleavage system protein H [Candidatus Heimdallarchaeaceae archaeon]
MKRNFIFPESHLYHSTFVWVEDRGRGVFRIGLTDYGQYVLDDIISISLPEKGIFVEKDEEIVSIDSIEDTFTINSPISGTIDEINMEIRQDPEILNESPYENGWILELEIGAADDLDSLMDYNDVLDSFHEETEDEDLDEDDEDNVDILDEDEDFNY